MSQAYKVEDRDGGKSCVATLSKEMKAVNKQQLLVYSSDKLKHFQEPKYQFLKFKSVLRPDIKYNGGITVIFYESLVCLNAAYV